MSANQSIAEQRDRFLAFAFAASDVLMEVNGRSEITFVAGSVKSLIGLSDVELMGIDLVTVAQQDDRRLLSEFLINLMETGRATDRLIRLIDGQDAVHQVSICGMASPRYDDVYHITFRKVPLAARRAQGQVPKSPMSVIDFSNSAALMCDEARQSGEKVNFTMYDVDWDNVERTVGAEEADQLNETLVQTMRAWSAGGSGVGQVGKGKYSLLLDEGVDATKLSKRIVEVAKESNKDLNLNVSETSLSISDVIDTDDFGAMFEQAMSQFDELGGEAFDLTGFETLVAPPPARSTDSIRDTMTKMAGKKKADEAELSANHTRRPARRKGVTEGWG